MTSLIDRAGTVAPISAPASARGDHAFRAATVALCIAHGLAIWLSLGGRAGMDGDWPPLRADHGLQFHHGLVTRQFLARTGTTAGYDPSFMGGYAMSLVSGPSTTLTAVMMAALPVRPALAYKIYVLACASAVPWLVALAAIAWRARPAAVTFAVALVLIYFWTDAGTLYLLIGMIPYLVAIPLGLVAVSALTAYLDRGGFGRWAWASASCSAVFLSHLTSPMVVGPAGLLAYAVAVVRSRRAGVPFPIARHVGLWMMVPVILAANAFWLIPGFALTSTQGPIFAFFVHSSESVLARLWKILWVEAPVEAILLGLAPIGLVAFARRDATAAAGLAGFLAAGFGLGYLAAAFPALDPIQPGRQTYAFYTGASIAAGFGLAEVLARLRPTTKRKRLDLWLAPLLIFGAIRVFGPSFASSARINVTNPDPILSSRPTAGIVRLVGLVREHVRPGDRVLYEETGLGDDGANDPFRGRHYSALLPWLAGVEVLGGPFLHVTVKANFTQFGEGKLFGREDWDRDHFTRYARLYRPAAILCWGRKARQFCRSNPDLVEVIDDEGPVLLGRVKGFEGAAIRGKARVEASAGRLVVRDAEPGPDGLVVLRYHAVPYLRATPPTAIEPVALEEDPVPFIGLRPTSPGPITLEMVPPPRAWFGR